MFPAFRLKASLTTNTYHIHRHRLKTRFEGLREPVVVKKQQELQLRKQTLYMLRVCEHERKRDKERQKETVTRDVRKAGESRQGGKNEIKTNQMENALYKMHKAHAVNPYDYETETPLWERLTSLWSLSK